jgi:hypothetical protein
MSTIKKITAATLGGLILASVASAAPAPNATNIKRLFDGMSEYRGPMGKNILQHEGSRTVIGQGSTSGPRQFQGAFRSNQSGRPLARNDFYIGNLFSSNYYELQETYVYGVDSNEDQDDSASYNPRRQLNLDALIAKSAEALPRAASMARHWVLEKYYVNAYPNSKLAQSFLRWGVGDSADEQDYATAYLNFYMSASPTDLQFLPLAQLIRHSPVGDSDESRSLQRARDLVAEYPNGRETLRGRIRNAIHNQLTPKVIEMIDQLRREEGGLPSELVEVKRILQQFFSYSPSKSQSLARALGQTEIERTAAVLAADESARRRSSIASLLAFSQAAAGLRSVILTDAVPSKKKAESLLLLTYASRFLSSRLINDDIYSDSDLTSKDAILAALNTVYIEGFLIKRNWDYFTGKINGASSQSQIGDFLGQATKIGTDTLIKAFTPALDQWKVVESRMESFVDNTVKSSALNTASVLLQKLGN